MLLELANMSIKKYLQTKLFLQSPQLNWKSILYPKLYRKHDLRNIMRIDLSKRYGNKAIFHKYQSLNREKINDQIILNETSRLNLIICHNKFA